MCLRHHRAERRPVCWVALRALALPPSGDRGEHDGHHFPSASIQFNQFDSRTGGHILARAAGARRCPPSEMSRGGALKQRMRGWRLWTALTTTAATAVSTYDQSAVTTRDRSHASARNLVVFNSIGRVATMHHVLHTLSAHFSDPTEWQCVAMVWGRHMALKMALRATSLHPDGPLACVLHVSTGARWGDFLHLLTSAVVTRFEHVAVLLDDLFAPASGPFAIHVPRLLEAMQTHQLGGISPAIFGAHAKPMLHLTGNKRARACVRYVRGIEVFFSIYTHAAWSCMAETLFDANNVGGCAYGPRSRPRARAAVSATRPVRSDRTNPSTYS